MDLWSVIKTIILRWYVAVPLTAATVAGIVLVPRVVSPTYRAQGTALLAVPSLDLEALKQERRENLNPFLSFNPSLSISAEAIARILRDDGVRIRVGALGLDPKYVIYSEQNIPAVSVVSVADSPAIATRTVRYLLDQSITTMSQLQKGADVPPDQYIRIGTISYSKEAEVIAARQGRARVGLGAFGLALAGGAALGFDALATYARNSSDRPRRRERSWRRRAARGLSTSAPTEGPIGAALAAAPTSDRTDNAAPAVSRRFRRRISP